MRLTLSVRTTSTQVSDNLYPGFLSEFDYLVEGKDAVSTLLKTYWEPLWQYSWPHRINDQASGG